MPTAAYIPQGGSTYVFALLIEAPGRDTEQTISERLIPGTNDAVVDIIGKSVTRINGRARIDTFGLLKLIEGAVGTRGTLVYSEEPGGVQVILTRVSRVSVVGVNPNDKHICDIQFLLIPTGAVILP